jgi:hypothetical protein
MDELAQAQESLSKNASALMQSGIAAATGIPINEIEALASGDLKDLQRPLSKTKSSLLPAALPTISRLPAK